MLATVMYPLPISGANFFSYVFPGSVQAFYDAVLEPIFDGANGNRALLEAVPPSLATIAIAVLDPIICTLFAAYYLCTPAAVAIAALIVTRKSLKA